MKAKKTAHGSEPGTHEGLDSLLRAPSSLQQNGLIKELLDTELSTQRQISAHKSQEAMVQERHAAIRAESDICAPLSAPRASRATEQKGCGEVLAEYEDCISRMINAVYDKFLPDSHRSDVEKLASFVQDSSNEASSSPWSQMPSAIGVRCLPLIPRRSYLNASREECSPAAPWTCPSLTHSPGWARICMCFSMPSA